MTVRLLQSCALAPLACAALLTACGSDDAGVSGAEDHSDPLMSAALEEQIMVDPDMISRNGANQVAAVPDGIGAIPRPDSGSDAALAARSEAEELVGGASAMRRAPAPTRVDGALPPEAALSVASRAATSGGPQQRDCAGNAQFSARWAAQMPAAFPVYPRGNVLEAAGNDAGGCALRVVNFATAASVSDVMDFYYTRASAAGFTLQHVVQGGDNVLGGSGRTGSVMVFARAVDGGLTTVDLVTSGG